MMNNFVKGSVALLVSRTTAGLNINCTKFLLPLWLAPMELVSLRLVFGALFFWIISVFDKPDTSSLKDKVKLFLLGAFMVFGYMSLSAVAISYTTPINFAIFNATQPMWVFLFSVVLCNEKVTAGKVVGILLGFSGVVVTAFAEPPVGGANDPVLGNFVALAGAVVYALYLLYSSALLRRVSNLTMLRYTFLGAAFSALVVSAFTVHNVPLAFLHPHPKVLWVVLFVLVFPTAINYLLVPVGIKYLRATLVSIFGYVSLIVATIVSLLTGQDRFDTMLILSMLLICVGIAMVSVSERG